MKQLDQPDTIDCSPYLTNRIMARIEAIDRPQTSTLKKRVFKPVLVPVLFGLVVLMNLTSVLYMFQDDHSHTYVAEGYATTYIQKYATNNIYSSAYTVNY